MCTVKEREILAYAKVNLEYTKNYDEITDSLYMYMKAYINGSKMEATMFMDEVENLIGLNNHEEIINYILGGEK